MLEELREILNLNKSWNSCVVGVGKLGEAVINYQGFKDEGYLIKVAFDISIPKSKNINNVEIKSIVEEVQEKEFKIELIISGLSDLHFSMILCSKSAISFNSTSSR